MQILVVDDVEINRLILFEILTPEFDVVCVESGMAAIDYLYNARQLPAMVLLDIMMPEMDGYEVLSVMQSSVHTARIPVIFITAAEARVNETKGLAAGAVDYISKPFNVDVVCARVRNHIALKSYRDSLEQLVDEKVQELTRTKENMLETMASIIEYRNLESGQHVRRTRVFSDALIHHLLKDPRYCSELIENDFEVMIKATPLHDVGKIGISDAILLKPGRLTPEEFLVIQTHTTIGSDIIDSMLENDDSVYLRHCRDICRYHHERWDGLGYPDRLKETGIPLSARIVAIIDVYDALTSTRVYKPAMSHDEALQIVLDGSGKQFDPNIVKVFADNAEQFRNLV